MCSLLCSDIIILALDYSVFYLIVFSLSLFYIFYFKPFKKPFILF